MNNKKPFFLKTALLISFLLGCAALPAGTAASTAIGELSGSLAQDGAAPVPAKISIPLAAPAGDEDEGRAAQAAPQPGRDFLPVIQDAARIKAIMKLVSDIYNGKPLPYSQDGVTFKNKEGRLPQMPAGYYKEYTLLTGSAPHTVTIGGITYTVAPDLSARGSERVIIGGGQRIYYTPDHYANFIELTVVY